MLFRILTVTICLFIIIACGGKGNHLDDGLVNGKPSWYWSPAYDGGLGGIGEAGFHAFGASEQRKLAISRAIEEIARQKGVTVSNTQTIAQTANSSGSSSSTTVESYSVQTVEGIQISARVREVWQDPVTGKIVVWVTEN